MYCVVILSPSMIEEHTKRIRSPFQGIGNILFINWSYYLLTCVLMLVLAVLEYLLPSPGISVYKIALFLICTSLLLSLIVSYYIYDLSSLYRFTWLKRFPKIPENAKIVNIHAGIDETSQLIKRQFPEAYLLIYSLYDRLRHNEKTIEKAQERTPLYPYTISISLSFLPLMPNSVDAIFLIISAHRLKNQEERIRFFKQMQEALKPNGQLIVVEHVRDTLNLMAYTWGASHFLPTKAWRKIFDESNLLINQKRKVTPFLTVYSLGKPSVQKKEA